MASTQDVLTECAIHTDVCVCARAPRSLMREGPPHSLLILPLQQVGALLKILDGCQCADHALATLADLHTDSTETFG